MILHYDDWLHELHWQDMFHTALGKIFNDPISADDHKKIKDIGILRYRNDTVFHHRVKSLTTSIVAEVRLTIAEEKGDALNGEAR